MARSEICPFGDGSCVKLDGRGYCAKPEHRAAWGQGADLRWLRSHGTLPRAAHGLWELAGKVSTEHQRKVMGEVTLDNYTKLYRAAVRELAKAQERAANARGAAAPAKAPAKAPAPAKGPKTSGVAPEVAAERAKLAAMSPSERRAYRRDKLASTAGPDAAPDTDAAPDMAVSQEVAEVSA